MAHPDNRTSRAFASVMVALILAVVAPSAFAEKPAAQLSDARIRLLPGDLPLAGYFHLTNTSDRQLSLEGAASPTFGMVMMHQSIEKNGTAKMVPVDHVDLAPGGSVDFAPGGYHLMLMKRNKALKAGDMVPITLRFDHGIEVQAAFKVVPAGGE